MYGAELAEKDIVTAHARLSRARMTQNKIHKIKFLIYRADRAVEFLNCQCMDNAWSIVIRCNVN